jgi:hypothetical protein
MQPAGRTTRILGAILALVLGGCGSGGPALYELSGIVIYDGKPVPKGLVMLTPDTSKGNKGPDCRVAIVDGRYRTEEDKGFVGGPHVVRIVGYDGVPTRWQGEDLPDGKSLFSPYQAKVDFPQQDGEFNFAITKAGK